jgi:hypothetical protein
MSVTKGSQPDYTLAEIVKKQKEIIEAIKINYSKLQLASNGKAFKTIDREQLVLKQKDLRDKLVLVKVLVNKYNSTIYHEIFQLSEAKVFLNELKMANSPRFEGEIKFTEAKIARLETAIRKHNESVKVAWFQMIGTRLYDPII